MTKPIESFDIRGINFLREQEGETERAVKGRWLSEPDFTSGIREAYLVLACYEGSDRNFVLLAIDADENGFQRAMASASKIFRAMFNQQASLDFIRLSDDQRLAIVKVARPFFPPPPLTQRMQ